MAVVVDDVVLNDLCGAGGAGGMGGIFVDDGTRECSKLLLSGHVCQNQPWQPLCFWSPCLQALTSAWQKLRLGPG